jgi:hypothetical protein
MAKSKPKTASKKTHKLEGKKRRVYESINLQARVDVDELIHAIVTCMSSEEVFQLIEHIDDIMCDLKVTTMLRDHFHAIVESEQAADRKP